MRNLGILILVAGLALGLYAITMDVSVSVAARDFGYGIQTPRMEVANLDKMSQRQNFIIFSGILSVVGAILLGFGSMQLQTRGQISEQDVSSAATSANNELMSKLVPPPSAPGSFSICPRCRHMGSGDDMNCKRCGVPFTA